MIGPRMYLHILATAENVETLREWAKIQAAIHRKDKDVIAVEATLVLDDSAGKPLARLVKV